MCSDSCSHRTDWLQAGEANARIGSLRNGALLAFASPLQVDVCAQCRDARYAGADTLVGPYLGFVHPTSRRLTVFIRSIRFIRTRAETGYYH